ncbi:MAG: HAMP domain-containing histidine kinase [Saprospiraceae bacterium]|nr:HAMP domain-containing histidine kinase [Bacteroidia bacterium]NNE14155.1 HAMP domain-containing histidine kinase [Saprospiraceae bacterium]NNL93530.1 HAMP domain-containing histidine kinase [Saprospiraceae bacterium]
MHFYKNNSFLKVLIAIIGLAIVLITMVYSQYLARQLKEREEATVELFTNAINIVTKETEDNGDGNDILMVQLVLEKFTGIMPLILEDESGSLIGYNYIDEESNSDQKFLNSRKNELLESGFVPINGYGSSSKIYYEHSRLYKLIKFFPIAQFLLLTTFVLFGYFFLLSTRKSEENRIWAGMAKETAHQLGTPISAIIGWIEHLKDIARGQPDQMEVVDELQNDVDRLELIADRFSKIGSKPDLTKINIVTELEGAKKYMQRRASRKVIFNFNSADNNPIFCNINSHLFNWVIENLIRNSLDAMGGTGTITADIFTENNMAIIELTDTGKGIPSNQFKKVFKPGFTTKKRGWGLGLSLAKRIIENYHSGKIFIKNSKPNEGTTFAILLPLA